MYLKSIHSILLVIVLSAAICACGVDDDMLESEIVGNWVLQQQDASNCDRPDDNGSEALSCTSLACSRLIFSDSSTYTMEVTVEGVTTSENGPFTVRGNELSLCTEADEDGPSSCQDWDLTLHNNTLIVSSSVRVDGCNVRRSYVRN